MDAITEITPARRPEPRSSRDRIDSRAAAGARPDELLAWAAGELGDQFRIRSVIGEAGYWLLSEAAGREDSRTVFLGIRAREDLSGPEQKQLTGLLTPSSDLHHPGIAAVEVSGLSRRLIWFQTPYRPSRLLGDRLDAQGPLSLSHLLILARCLSEALSQGHARGDAHGALSPWNVLVGGGAGAGILGWGVDLAIYHARCNSSKDSGVLARYIAPELIRAGGATPAGDQFSLALLLLDSIGGAPSRDGVNEVAVPDKLELRFHHRGDVHHEFVAPAAREVLVRALSTQPERRYPDIAGFSTAFLREISRESCGRSVSPRSSSLQPPRSEEPVVLVPLPEFQAPAGGMRVARAGHGPWRLAAGVLALLGGTGAFLLGGTSDPVGSGEDPANAISLPALRASPVEPDAQGIPTSDPPPDSMQISIATPESPLSSVPAPRVAAPPIPTIDPGQIRLAMEEIPALPPTAPPPSPAPGLLYLNSEPWGEVYLDGRRIGTTPLLALPLPPGRYLIRVERRGYLPYIAQIRMASGMELRRTGVVLAPGES